MGYGISIGISGVEARERVGEIELVACEGGFDPGTLLFSICSTARCAGTLHNSLQLYFNVERI